MLTATRHLQVGNGDFAVGCDVTGLQTFYGNTLSNWGWHEEPLPVGMKPRGQKTDRVCDAREETILSCPHNEPELVRWLYDNPHRANLGRLRFVTGAGRATDRCSKTELTNIRQKLDLWSGLLVSEFEWNGKPVRVETVCHATQDIVAVRVVSPWLAAGELSVVLDFPYPVPTGNDWGRPEGHVTQNDAYR